MKRTNKINKARRCSTLVLVWTLFGIFHIQAQTGQRFKQTDYKYDLISGKVNEVHYQAGEPDAFYHIYKYDADNRITEVYTSKDSVIWDHDAGYTYYAHGPLARVGLGDNKVQGMDYVYTLQGWIKGVNSNLLTSENDIGNDGLAGGKHGKVAKDAFGYTLNYHADDYQPINSQKWSIIAQRFEAFTPNSDLMTNRFDLYNGNISSMVTTIEEPKIYTGAANEIPNILPQGTAYKYDQLNRLVEMKAFQNLGADPAKPLLLNQWQQGGAYTGMYHNAFKYDANGNILYQERADQNGVVFDKLTYQYKTGVGGERLQNRLYHVNDGNTNTTLATDDIEDEGTFMPSPSSPVTINDVNNYRYDEIGNLKHDKQEGIDKIEWTVYGKIKSITRVAGSLKSDLEFNYDAGGNRIAKIEKPRDAGGVKPVSDWIATYYGRDAQGNVMGIYKLTVATGVPSFKVMERNLFGSSRLGSDNTEVELVGSLPNINPFTRTLGNKYFEGSNHLGNVLAVFSDRKIARDDSGDGKIDYFQTDVASARDFYAYGANMSERSFKSNIYRYGVQSKEKIDEFHGNSGDVYDFDARVLEGRLGRWLTTDPMQTNFPWNSSYSVMSNDPINRVDPTGMGDYYSKEGKHLGSDNKTKTVGEGKEAKEVADDKAYIATQETIDKNTAEGKTDWDKVIADKSTTDITTTHNYTNSQLLQGAAMAYNEGESTFEGRSAIVNVLMNRQAQGKTFDQVMGGLAGGGVGKTHEARMKSNWFVRYQSFFNAGNEGRNKSKIYQSCISASLGAMTGGKDYSNNSLFWHGIDFFSNVCQKSGKDWVAYRDEYLTKGFQWASDAEKKSTIPSFYYEIKGSTNNDYFYLGKAYYGKNTFMNTKK